MTLRDLFMQAHWYSQKGAFIIETKSIQCIYIEARYVQKTEGRKNNEDRQKNNRPCFGMSVGTADSGPLFPEDIVASYAAGNTHPEDPDNEKTEDTALDALMEHRAEGEKHIGQEICLTNRPEAGIPLPCRSTGRGQSGLHGGFLRRRDPVYLR